MREPRNQSPFTQYSVLSTQHFLRSRAFTLVEMLTVIGIIVLLLAILMPVVSAVRKKGQAADSGAMLQRIAAGIQSYYGDFSAYPGPLHNSQIRGTTGGSLPMVGGGTIDLGKVTQAENLTLGLLGGLVINSSGVQYDLNAVGQGPISLNPRNPKKFKAYMDKVSLTPRDQDPAKGYDFKDDVADAEDTQIAEFVDKFPDGLPILYLRANQGRPGVASNTTNYAQQEQYDLNQIIGYTKLNIGVGKEVPAEEYAPSPATFPQHGLKTVDPTKSVITPGVPPPGQGTTYQYPYDFYAFMRHPTLSTATTQVPKQKDGFLLISAGADRVYGTKDDIQFPAGR